MRAKTILDTIGNTPHVQINKLYSPDYEVYIKMEKFNPGGSIKDRIALNMVEVAEKNNILGPGSVIIEPTSGNTGIGLAMVAAVKGYRVILVMPESMSVERRNIMKAYGAEIDLTPREKGMKGSISRAMELKESIPGSWIPSQFDNPANPDAHTRFTAMEIKNDFTEGLDYLVTGVGTGGHITGVGKELKKVYPELKIFAVEPEDSPVISGGEPGPHPIQGIGAGFIPGNLETDILDGVIKVSKDEAFSYAKAAGTKEGLFIGISSGASLAAVAKKLPEMEKGSKILCFNYDTGERYLSVDGLFNG